MPEQTNYKDQPSPFPNAQYVRMDAADIGGGQMLAGLTDEFRRTVEHLQEYIDKTGDKTKGAKLTLDIELKPEKKSNEGFCTIGWRFKLKTPEQVHERMVTMASGKLIRLAGGDDLNGERQMTIGQHLEYLNKAGEVKRVVDPKTGEEVEDAPAGKIG